MMETSFLAERPRLEGAWDVVVVGGGITGAGVFRRAAAMGLRCLLVEQRDFAWGTSSRSAKLVHGGLRYIVQGQLRVSYQSVRERERLLEELPGLVNLIDFAFAAPRDGFAAQVAIEGLLRVWDLMAGRPNHRRLDPKSLSDFVPGMATRGRGGFVYGDGSTDDARLVLRVMQDGLGAGSVARNYTRVTGFGRDETGRIVKVHLHDAETQEDSEIEAQVVINATGAWADELRHRLGCPPVIRKLRGSHLVIPQSRLPIPCAVAFQSPSDRRNLYAVPWEGVTLVGTTDRDHDRDLSEEPFMTPDEGAYLLEGIDSVFPDAGLGPADVLCSQAGVRPVIGTGKADPSKEARDSLVVADQNLITISGGKLTTFDFMARRAIQAARPWLKTISEAPETPESAEAEVRCLPLRIAGRFGRHAFDIVDGQTEDELVCIPGTSFTWAEARWSAAHEQVMHLDDLLLRRTRVGMLLPRGGLGIIDSVRRHVGPVLGWSDARWQAEIARYDALWSRAYGPERLLEVPQDAAEPPLAAAG